MNSTNLPKARLIISLILIYLISIIVLFFFSSINDIFELKITDVKFRLRNRYSKKPEISNKIFNLSLDDYSFSKEMDWNRNKIGILLEKLSVANTSVTGCDFIIANYRKKEDDKKLIESFKQAGNIISPIVLTEETQNTPFHYGNTQFAEIQELSQFDGIGILPLAEILEYSIGYGFVNMQQDTDGIVRRYSLVRSYNNLLLPSFTLSLLAAYLDYDLDNIEITKKRIFLRSLKLPGSDNLKDITIPLDEQGNMLINFAGKLKTKTFPQSFSAYDLFITEDPTTLSDQLADKIGIIADISLAGKDFCNTPLETNFPTSFLYTNLISNILNEDFIIPVDQMSLSVILALLFFGFYLLNLRFKFSKFILFSIIILVFCIALNFLLFMYLSWQIPFFPIMLPLLFVILIVSAHKYYFEQKHLLSIKQSFQSFLSPPLLKKIEKDPNILIPGGVRKRISILFTDIAGFTTFCDNNDPKEVQNVLEEYLGKMVPAVFANDGIIDKYLGDGLLAFFENNNDDEIQSPSNAANTALQMLNEAEQLRTKWAQQHRFDLQIRIGVSTGYAAVGNLGPVEKMDYTIIGSKVNLASRLQSYGDSGEILLDEETNKLLIPNFITKKLGKIEIKGFAKKIPVFKLIGKNNV